MDNQMNAVSKEFSLYSDILERLNLEQLGIRIIMQTFLEMEAYPISDISNFL